MSPFVGCGKYPDLNYLSSLFGLSSPKICLFVSLPSPLVGPPNISALRRKWSADINTKQAAELNLFMMMKVMVRLTEWTARAAITLSL